MDPVGLLGRDILTDLMDDLGSASSSRDIQLLSENNFCYSNSCPAILVFRRGTLIRAQFQAMIISTDTKPLSTLCEGTSIVPLRFSAFLCCHLFTA